MTTDAILAHAVSVGHGIGASLVCLVCFGAAGFAVVPRRWSARPGGAATLTVVGAALYTLACWVGIFINVPITWTAVAFAAGACALSGARLALRGVVRQGLEAMPPRIARRNPWAGIRAWIRWGLSFALLYVLAYVFTMPPAGADLLPPAWTGNVDLMTYALYTKHLLSLGPSNLEGLTYLNFVYLQTPGVFALLGGLALVFGQDPLSALMPAMFALTALVGIAAADITRSVFRLPRLVALALAAALISGPFYRYIAGAYFLSTIMAVPVLLYLLRTTVSGCVFRALLPQTVVRFGSAYVLLLLIYPFLLLIGLAGQCAAIALLCVERCRTNPAAWREALRRVAGTVAAILVPLVPLAVAVRQPSDPNRFADAPSMSRLEWTIDVARSLSEKGVAGWSLDLISPLAVLGWPGTITGPFHITDPGLQAWVLGAFGAVALALGAAYFGRFRSRTTLAQRAWAGLAGGSLLLYCAYYLWAGASYQQWKFASYTALPLSFIVLAAAFALLRVRGVELGRDAAAATQRPGMAAVRLGLLRALPLSVALGLVAGNLVVHAWHDPELRKIPGTFRSLAAVDALPFRNLTVQMADGPDALASRLALYFLPNKHLRIISPYFQPSVPLTFGGVSRDHPLLLQDYGCEGVGHADTFSVPDIGCLLYGPPSLALDVSYPFNRSFLFIDFEGLGPREAEGRWNRGSRARLALLADVQRAGVSSDAYVNLLLSPRLEPGGKKQDVLFSWGVDRHGACVLDGRQWFSLPVGGADWAGQAVRTLSVSIGIEERAGGPSDSGTRGGRGGTVLFEEVSVSPSPRGLVVQPGGAVPH